MINHMGVKLTSLINDVMVSAQILVILVVGILLLILAVKNKTNSFHFLFTHPGHPGGMAFLGPLAFSSLMAVLDRSPDLKAPPIWRKKPKPPNSGFRLRLFHRRLSA